MILLYFGHSFFSLELADGRTIAMDPYGDLYRYPQRKIKADYCLLSHGHSDHAGRQCISEGCRFLTVEGKTNLGDGTTVTGIPVWHDTEHGARRGGNLFFVIEAEGLRIGHAGDLGHVLTQKQLDQIGRLDLLMIPVGGYYTATLEDTLSNLRLLNPAVTIPMHYRTKYNSEMPIAPLFDFLRAVGAKDVQMPILRVTSKDICERPKVITMSILP